MTIMRRSALAVFAAVLVFTVLSFPAPGFLSGPVNAGATDLSAINEALLSLGVNPTEAILQEGLLNYAGPNCPGDEWNCVKDTTKPIVQSAYDGGFNLFECPLITACTVIQREASEGGMTSAVGGSFSGVAHAKGEDKKAGINNVAHCIQNPSGGNSSDETQECTIEQATPAGGKNVAAVNMVLIQEGTMLNGTQDATVTQTNESGDNTAKVRQKIEQTSLESASGTDPVSQTFEAHQSLALSQDASAGANSADVSQEQLQTSEATTETGTISQSHNASDDGSNAFADLDQISETGNQDIMHSQVITQTGEATSNTGNIEQVQGSVDGGLDAAVHQDSSGISTYGARQDENQNLAASTGGTLTQAQFGPIICCIALSQLGNESNSCTIGQDSDQVADDDADQTSTVETSFNTSGECTATIHIQNNDAEFNDSFTGQTFDQVSNCTGDVCTATQEGALVSVSISDDGGAVAAGTGLRNRDLGEISISGIPAGATVQRAVLVWAVLYDSSAGVPPNTITFEENPLTADRGTISGQLCWGDTNTIGYFKDVTPFVTGNGIYEVSDPPRGTTRVDSDPSGALPFTDGASLIVLFSGGGADDQVLANFAYDTNTDDGSSITRDFTGITSTGGNSSLILAGPDGQNNGGEVFDFTGSGTISVEDTWDGSDPQIAPSFGIGNLWDTDLYDVSSVMPAGQSTFTFDHAQGGTEGSPPADCIGVAAAVLKVSQSGPSSPQVD